MNQIYRVVVGGKSLESRDIRKLLARAVAEKKSFDWRFRHFLRGGLLGDGPGAVTADLPAAGRNI